MNCPVETVLCEESRWLAVCGERGTSGVERMALQVVSAGSPLPPRSPTLQQPEQERNGRERDEGDQPSHEKCPHAD